MATPPSHILGLLNLLAAASAGATVRLHRRFDLDEVLQRIESERMTLEMAVAPIALAMANHPDIERYDLSSLRYIMWGATPVSEHVARVVTERTGVRWLPAYGASEVPVIACNPVQDPGSWRLDSAGLPPEGVELRVADLDTGEVLPSGGIGEIQVSSPSVMAGYLPEEETASAFADGWYRTGDVGWLEPEGWVHLTDRSKEMIKVNGFQVAPAEVEEVLRSHPSVLDCAVFGLADERAGEVPVAVVQVDPDRPATAEEIQELVAGSLATYKQVRHVVFVDAIPRLPSGKVLRRTLRDEWTPVLLAAGRERLMDVRLSSEQQALRDSVAQVVDRLGPDTVRDLDDAERSRQARRRRGRLGLARAPGPDRGIGRHWRPGSKRRSSPRSSAVVWPIRRSSGPRWPPNCGGWPVRRRPARPRPSRSPARWPPPPWPIPGCHPAPSPPTPRGRPLRWCWYPTAGATRWPRSRWARPAPAPT